MPLCLGGDALRWNLLGRQESIDLRPHLHANDLGCAHLAPGPAHMDIVLDDIPGHVMLLGLRFAHPVAGVRAQAGSGVYVATLWQAP